MNGSVGPHMVIKKFAWLFAFSSVANADAGPAEVAPTPACVVTVTREQVSARFPALESPTDSWRWHRKSTHDGAGEYSWLIRFEMVAGPGGTPQQDYSHSLGISIFKFPNSAERAGTFAELMRAAQGDLWHCDSSGSACTRAQGVRFTGALEPGYTRISIERDPGVNALLAARPQGAFLSGGTPDQNWYCHAIVHYK